jgi:hypothetical protein
MTYRIWLFKIVSVLSAVIGLYHAICIFYPLDSSPGWRHAIFVCISLFCFYNFKNRPEYFVYFFFAVLIQQAYSHGSYLLRQWNDYGKIDWISVLLLIFLPVVFFNLVIDSRSRAR